MLKRTEPTPMKGYAPEDFRLLCAWCHREIRPAQRQYPWPPPESHGICIPCALALGMPAEYYPELNVA